MAGNATAIEVAGLTKRYGRLRAVDDLSFTVDYGNVVGFIGPNGAGKTTTLRSIVGHVRPDGGEARVAGRRYRDLADPLGTVGAVLEAGAVHPDRSGRNHLRVLARQAGISLSRVDQLIETLGLGAAARRRVRGYSLGMRQRLALAGALLGDPAVLILDEPANGLDPEGIRWLRDLLRSLAAEGRAVLVSSHGLAELALTVDKVVVLGHGRLITQSSLADLAARAGGPTVRIRVSEPRQLASRLRETGREVREGHDHTLVVSGDDAGTIARLAFENGHDVVHLTTEAPSLEAAYFELTAGKDSIR